MIIHVVLNAAEVSSENKKIAHVLCFSNNRQRLLIEASYQINYLLNGLEPYASWPFKSPSDFLFTKFPL